MSGNVDHPALPYRLVTSLTDFDMDAVFDYLTNEAYWSKGINRDLVDTAWANSLAFGVMTSNGQQVGAARVVTDQATYGYLADVYILEVHQGQGLGKWMIDHIMKHPDLQMIRRFMLATSNMHSLYEQFGFQPLSNPDIIMEKLGEGAYRGGS